MGAELVKIASARWGHIGYSPYRILIRMAVQALDKTNAKGDQPGVYFGGWEDLAQAIGRDPDAAIDARAKAAIRHEVKRHTRTLREAGAIKPLVDNPGIRHRQVWKLTL